MRKWIYSILAVLLLLVGCSDNQQEKKAEKDEPAAPIEELDDSEKVIEMEGKTFNKKEMEFYALMQKIFIERNRSEDLKSGNEIEKINNYWDS